MFAYCNNDPISFADVSGNMRTYSVMMTDSMCRSYCEIQSLRLNNENEHIVLSADTFAFYKGTLVAKIPFMDDNAFSYGIIFLGSNVTSTETLKHEYGHSVHMDQIGVLSYTVNVFIPSLIGFWSGVPYDEYYSQAYEYVADMLGGVERTLYGQPYKYSITNVEASFYYLYTLLFP